MADIYLFALTAPLMWSLAYLLYRFAADGDA